MGFTLAALALVASLARQAPPALVPPEPTELEQARVALVQKQLELNELQTKYAAALQDLNNLKLALMVQQSTPKCGDTGKFAWDWTSLTCKEKK